MKINRGLGMSLIETFIQYEREIENGQREDAERTAEHLEAAIVILAANYAESVEDVRKQVFRWCHTDIVPPAFKHLK